MKMLFFFNCFFLFQFALFAQEKSPIGYAIYKYEDLQKRIEKKTVFVDEFKLNANKLSWNDQKLYLRREQYFYEVYESEKPFLSLINIEIDSVSSKYFLEYLYDSTGDLLMCVEKQVPKKNNYEELRVYFDRGNMILWVEDRVSIKSSSIFQIKKIDMLLKSAKFYWDKFQQRIK